MGAEARVELLKRVADPRGGLWHPGEVAAFDPEVAARLVARGAARYLVAPALPIADGPPADRMAREAGAVRKARRPTARQ